MKRIFLVLFFQVFICLNSFGFTFYVQTVNGKEYSDLTPEEKEIIASLEDGVMDNLFEGGHIFFSLIPGTDITAPLEAGLNAGADFVIIIKPDLSNSIVNFEILDTASRKKIGSGILSGNNVRDAAELSIKDLFYKFGVELTQQVFVLIQ